MKRAEHEAADELAVFGYLLGGDIEGELLHPPRSRRWSSGCPAADVTALNLPEGQRNAASRSQ